MGRVVPPHGVTAALARPVLMLWPLLLLAEAAVQPYRAVLSYRTTDWVAFVVGSRLVHDGAGAALYTESAQTAMHASVLGDTVHLSQYANPPLFAFLLQPLALLPVQVSTGIWAATLTACIAVAVAVFAGLLPRAWGRARRAAVALTTVALVPAVDAVAWGQLAPAVLPLLAVALRRLDRRRDSLLAGLLLACLAVKPQFVWLVPAVLVMLGARRTMFGFAAGCLVWALSTLALVGVDGAGRWLTTFIPGTFVAQAWGGAGIPSVLVGLGLDPRASFVIAVPIAGGALLLMWRSRQRWRDSPALAVALAITLSVLCSPHAFDHDLALLGPVLLLSSRERSGAAVAAAIGMGATFLAADVWTALASWHPVTWAAIVAVVVVVGRSRHPNQAFSSRAAPAAMYLTR